MSTQAAIHQTTNILGSTVHYWTFHDTKPITIVALHGFRGTHHGLLKIIARLDSYRVIIPDLPGFGDSTPMTERSHDIAGYKDFATAFIRTVSPRQPVILLGHSFGSIIGADLAANAPELVTRLIFINPIAAQDTNPFDPALAVGRFYYWMGGKILPEALGMKLLKSSAIILAGSILMTKTKDKALRKAIHKTHIEHFGSFHGRAILNESYDASLRHTIAEHTQKLSMPTLLIAGSEDDIAPAKGQYLLQKALRNAQLVMIPNVGHLIHYETPDQAAEAICRFLG